MRRERMLMVWRGFINWQCQSETSWWWSESEPAHWVTSCCETEWLSVTLTSDWWLSHTMLWENSHLSSDNNTIWPPVLSSLTEKLCEPLIQPPLLHPLTLREKFKINRKDEMEKLKLTLKLSVFEYFKQTALRKYSLQFKLFSVQKLYTTTSFTSILFHEFSIAMILSWFLNLYFRFTK